MHNVRTNRTAVDSHQIWLVGTSLGSTVVWLRLARTLSDETLPEFRIHYPSIRGPQHLLAHRQFNTVVHPLNQGTTCTGVCHLVLLLHCRDRNSTTTHRGTAIRSTSQGEQRRHMSRRSWCTRYCLHFVIHKGHDEFRFVGEGFEKDLVRHLHSITAKSSFRLSRLFKASKREEPA